MYRIMVIEDNDKIRNELCDFLSKNGYEAFGPAEFDHLLEDIHQQKPDLLLLDLNLPVVDGHFICREVRKNSELPIMIVTKMCIRDRCYSPEGPFLGSLSSG